MTFDDMKGTPLNQPALDQRHRDQGWSAMHGGNRESAEIMKDTLQVK